jgi:hypothetical protein
MKGRWQRIADCLTDTQTVSHRTLTAVLIADCLTDTQTVSHRTLTAVLINILKRTTSRFLIYNVLSECNKLYIYTGCFIMYSGIKKIYYRKTVGHVFMKPVQIEGTTQKRKISQ